jgi:transposase InsO family protein
LTYVKAVEFIQDIIFSFGIPNSIITGLGSNFTSSEFFDFCEQRSIQIKYASVADPRANGQVERANRMILEALRKKVFDKSEKLVGNGSENCHTWSGACEINLVELCMEIPCSSWFMGQRQCCLPI